MRPDIKILLLGVAALIVLAAYSFADFRIGDDGAEVRKADFVSLCTVDDTSVSKDILPKPDKAQVAPETGNDTAATLKSQQNVSSSPAFEADTAQNILFFGDSMLEGLAKRFIDYTEHNNHQLRTVIWYSSTSDTWANTDTLQYFLKKYDPSYVVVCLGANELFVKDIDKRRENIRKIVGKLGARPYVWISPPNWKDDTGINEAIISVVGRGRYFDSRNLTLARKSDHAHPTDAAAEIWMDTIARWLKSPECVSPLVMEWPEKKVKYKNLTLLKPYQR